jgi:hypothetical protein
MESNHKSFEQQWQEALTGASETPPAMVWEKIEEKLDQKKSKRGFVFWLGHRGVQAGLAAMLILALAVFVGPEYFGETKASKEVFASNAKDKNAKLEQKESGNTIKTEQLAANEAIASDKIIQESITETAKGSTSSKQKIRNEISTLGQVSALRNDKSVIENPDNSGIGVAEANMPLANSRMLFGSQAIATNNQKRLQTKVEYMASLPFDPFGSRFVNKRSKLEYYDLKEDAEINEVVKQKIYLGFQSGVAPFNPNYASSNFRGEALSASRGDQSTAFTNKSADVADNTGITGQGISNNVLPNALPNSSFQNGRSLNLGFSVGKKIFKKLGFESGLRLLRGSSTLNSNVYAVNNETGEVRSFFETNYLSNAAVNTNTIISVQSSDRQLYNYLNVPFQLTYAIPILPVLEVEVLAGVSTDLFLQSRINNSISMEQSLNAQNSRFNALNLSGLEGLRLNYAVSRNWELNFGAGYQHALFSGLDNGGPLSFKPRMFGANYGVKYKLH